MLEKSKLMLKRLLRLRKRGFRDAYVRANIEHGIAHQIRIMRTSRGWSQSQLADKIGVKGQSSVARLEDPSYGRHTMATLLRTAQAFDVGLMVKFVSYGKLLRETEDLSPQALNVEKFDVEFPKLHAELTSQGVLINVTPKIATPSFREALLVSTPSGPMLPVSIHSGGAQSWLQ